MARSLKKGPFVASHVFERVEQMNASGKKDVIKTWSRATTILPWPKYDKKCKAILGQPLPTREIEQRILRVHNGDQRQVFKHWYEREPNTWKFDSILMFGVTSKACLQGALATQDTFRSLIGAIKS